MTVTYAVTVYNKAAYLAEVLAAIVVEHADTGGEILLVDDGSTDGSAALLAGFCAGNAAARVITQANAGVAAATNTVLAAASCRYTRLVDGDDIIAPGSTRALIRALESTGCTFGYGRMLVAGTMDRPVTGVTRIERDPLVLMLTRQPFIPSQTLGVTEVMQRVLPLPTTARTSQDFSLGVLLSAHTAFAGLHLVCCTVPPASGGLSSSKARMFRDTAMLSLTLAQRMGWGGRYQRLALSRWAGRARNYLRRHAPGQSRDIALMSVLSVLARVPFACPYRGGLSCVISAYDRVLAKDGPAP